MTVIRNHRADYADDEYIQELISFQFSSDAPCARTLDEEIVFTLEEDLQMLRLPQKECKIFNFSEHKPTLVILILNIRYGKKKNRPPYA
jgi:protein SHQ1